jgi:hypothetical protein
MKPLKIFAFVTDQDTYIKKINSKKVYEVLNYDSLIRGLKQKDVLMPTEYNEPTDSKN